MTPQGALRRPQPLPAAARREPRAQVGRALGASSTCACSRAARGTRPPLRLVRRRAGSTGRASTPPLPARIARELRALQAGRGRDRAEPVRGGSRRSSRARVARSPAKVVVEVHGDWHTSTRLYGSPGAALLGPLGRPRRRVSRCATPTRSARSPGSRPRCCARQGASRRPSSRPTPTSAPSSGARVPVPEEPRAIFVGVLERYKNVERARGGLADRRGAPPRGALAPVGSGTQTEVAAALARAGGRVGSAARAARACCRARPRARASAALCAPRGLAGSRSRRSCAGAAVVGSRDGRDPRHRRATASTGCSSSPATPAALAAAIERVLADHGLAGRLGAAAAASASPGSSTPAEYADRVRALVDAVLAT